MTENLKEKLIDVLDTSTFVRSYDVNMKYLTFYVVSVVLSMI